MLRAQFFFSMVFTYPSFPQSLGSAAGEVDLKVWKSVMINLEAGNNTFAVETYDNLVPEPAGPQARPLLPFKLLPPPHQIDSRLLHAASHPAHFLHACRHARAAHMPLPAVAPTATACSACRINE